MPSPRPRPDGFAVSPAISPVQRWRGIRVRHTFRVAREAVT